MIKVERGRTYPIRIGNMDGAKADFLTTDGNIMLIGMPGIHQSEAQAVRNGTVKAGFIKDGPLILWVFEFEGGLIFDCPFDARLIPSDRLYLPQLTGDQHHLYVEIHLVDSTTNVVRGLRGVTLPPSLSRDFLEAASDQLADVRDIDRAIERYRATDILCLPALAAVQVCGAN
jgi:hypothetical protein